MDEIIKELYKTRSDYKGLDTFKDIIKNNEEFRKTIIEGMSTGDIYAFPDELWDKMNRLHIEGLKINNLSCFEDKFKEGLNIGDCTGCSLQLAFSFLKCCIAGGQQEYLINTKNSPDGRHTWLIDLNGVIYDTTFMLVIDKKYASKLGYVEENRHNPNLDPNFKIRNERAHNR